MAPKNRKTLKHYFRSGAMPTEEHFRNLIDSFLNMKDEGFDRTADHGIRISTLGTSNTLLSFFKSIDGNEPLWSVDMTDDDTLVIKRHRETSIENNAAPDSASDSAATAQKNTMSKQYGTDIFTLSSEGNVGLKTKHPQSSLDVNGVITSIGRQGKNGDKEIAADGNWHPIIEDLGGCHCFEIMAGVGRQKSGKYALMHAFAINTFNDKKCIKYHQAHYYSRCNRIRLRWKGTQDNYRLEMKTNCNYGDTIVVRYSITQLWFDPYMKQCIKG